MCIHARAGHRPMSLSGGEERIDASVPEKAIKMSQYNSVTFNQHTHTHWDWLECYQCFWVGTMRVCVFHCISLFGARFSLAESHQKYLAFSGTLFHSLHQGLDHILFGTTPPRLWPVRSRSHREEGFCPFQVMGLAWITTVAGKAFVKRKGF